MSCLRNLSLLLSHEGMLSFFLFLSSAHDMLLILEDRRRETLMWERHINQLPPVHAPNWMGPATYVCALTRNWTHNLLVYRTMFQQLSHTGQGKVCCLIDTLLFYFLFRTMINLELTFVNTEGLRSWFIVFSPMKLNGSRIIPANNSFSYCIITTS